jgi:CHC2 zinc finger
MFKHIDIVSVLSGMGVSIQKSGSKHRMACPFHADTDPSLVFYDNSFHCFGCGKHGDIADFMMPYFNMTFQEVKNHFNIKSELPEKIERRKYENNLTEKFYTWVRKADTVLAKAILTIRQIRFRDIDHFSDYGDIYHIASHFEGWREILFSGNEKDRYDFKKNHGYLEKFFAPDIELPPVEFIEEVLCQSQRPLI